jgi:predicted dehydrogenase
VIEGAHGDNLPLEQLPVPAIYDRLPPSGLPSAVLELAQLYAAYAEDIHTGSRTAPTFDDALRMHNLLDATVESTESGRYVEVA